MPTQRLLDQRGLLKKKIHQDIASLEQKMNFSQMEKMFQMTLRASGQLTQAI